MTVNGANIVQFDNIKFDSNQIVATVVDSDLIFTANGTGIVKVLTSDVEIDHDLDVTGDGFFDTVNVDNTVVMDEFTIDDIYINDNKITTNTASGANTDLILQADGLGQINVPLTDVVITNDLTVNSLTTLTAVNIGTVLTPNSLTLTGAWNQTGAVDRTGDTDITGSLTVNGDHTAQFENIEIINNRIITTDTNSDLIFKSLSLTSIVNVVNTDVQIDNDLNVLLGITANSLEITNGVVAVDFNIGDLYIKDSITVVPNNTDLILGATGNVRFKTSDVEIANDLTVAGPFTVNGNTSLKDTVIRTEISTPTTTQTAQNVSGTSTPTGFFFYGWADDPGQINPQFGVIQVGWSCVEIPGSVVTVVGDGVTNYDITITGGSFASGGFYSFTGNVVTYGPSTLTQLGNIIQTGDTNITGTLQADGDISGVGASSFLSVNAVKLDTNIISATATDSDLQFSANGTGGVLLERYLKITNNDISNIFDSNNIELSFNNLMLAEDGQNLILEQGDFYLADTLLDGDLSVIFTPNGLGNVVINSNKAFAIAYGNDSDRILQNGGEIRQNSTTKVYEGKVAGGLVKFNNIYDTDGNTYITPELTPGANDNTLRFGINGVVKATIDSDKLFSDTLHVDNVRISGTTIDNLVSANNLIISPNGTGTVKFNNVSFAQNTITNNTDSALVFENTGTGYVKFAGNKAIIFPRGNDSQRYITPELGETRFNTDEGYLEVFNGTDWISATGSSNVATLDEIQAELDLWSLVLG